MNLNTRQLKELQDQSLGHVLFTAARMLDELAQQVVNAEAGAEVARPALMRLLPFLDFEGIRPTELARRVDISKQAVGKLLETMEQQGLVEFVEDTTDKRAFLVRLTQHGGAAYKHGLGVLSKIERVLRTELGTRRVDELQISLRTLQTTLAKMQQGRLR